MSEKAPPMDPNVLAVVTRLIPTVSVTAPTAETWALGPITSIAMEEGLLVLGFASGIAMRLALDRDAWAALALFARRGTPLAPGANPAEFFARLADALKPDRRFDA